MTQLPGEEDDKAYQDLLMMLLPETIRNFREACYDYLLKHNCKETDKRIAKEGFLQAMNKAFSTSSRFKALYELIFNRFKAYTCTVKSNRKNEVFRLSDIASTEEIDIYDISSALVVFSKQNFKDKIRLLFHITDLDDDTLINEREIKKMILTVNILFCKEEASYQANSKLIHLSLAKLQAKKIINMILKYPGDLGTIIAQSKFIDFDTFYSAIEKINNFKYLLIPFFINFKHCLFEERNDSSYDIKSNLAEDFMAVSNDLVHNSSFIKKKNAFEVNDETMSLTVRPYRHLKAAMSVMGRVNRKVGLFNKKEEKKRIINRSCELIERIDYNRLGDIDVLPGKINIKMIEEEKPFSLIEKIKLPRVRNPSVYSNKSSFCLERRSNKLRSYQDIMNEINTTLLYNGNEGRDLFEIERISKKIDTVSLGMKKLIKEKEQFNLLKVSNPSSSRSSYFS